MNRNRALSLKRRIVLETLETRETPAAMGLAASWANGLRAAVIADGANAAVGIANPPSSNITTRPDGSYNPPGTLSPDGMLTTRTLRNGAGAGAGLGAGSGAVTPTVPGGTLTSPTLPSSSRFSTQFLRFGAGTTGGASGGAGGVATGPGVTIPSTSTRFSGNFLRSGPFGGSVGTSPGTVTGGGIDLGGSGGGSVSTPGVTTPSVTVRFGSNFLRTGSPGSIATPGVTVPSVTVPSLTGDPTIVNPTGTGLPF